MWYLVLRRPTKPRDQWTVTLDQHLIWMKQQHHAGKILFSGPTTDRRYGVYSFVRSRSKKQNRLPPVIRIRQPDFAPSNCLNGRCTKSWESVHLRLLKCVPIADEKKFKKNLDTSRSRSYVRASPTLLGGAKSVNRARLLQLFFIWRVYAGRR